MLRILRSVGVCLSALSLILAPGRCAVLYVNGAAPGPTHNGTSWATAFSTIQAALDAAKSGDEVWVARGTYGESPIPPSVVPLIPPAGVAMYGGFAGTESRRNQRDLAANSSRVNGGVWIRNDNVTVDGFYITLGNTGVYVDAAHATIANNIISDNRVAALGGGIYLGANARSANINFNTIQNNTAGTGGGGIDVWGEAYISCNTIRKNKAGSGGGIKVESTGFAVIRSNVITGNQANRAAAIETFGYATITNNTIADNTITTTTVVGGSVAVGAGTANIVNNIVAFNYAGISVEPGVSVPNLLHNDVFGNGNANYTGVPDPTGRDGNNSADPQFFARAGGDYHLAPGSPCIDAGDTTRVYSTETDRDGRARILGPAVDIGAYEKPAPVASTQLPTTLQAPPATQLGFIYLGGDDGKLYAFTTPDLKPMYGFPADVSKAAGTPVKLNSRPAISFGRNTKDIYVTTDKDHVVDVTTMGSVRWVAHPLNGFSLSTPAVAPDGNLYTVLGLGTTNVANFLFKIDQMTGRPVYISPYLGSSPANALKDRSPAVDGRYVYVNASGQGLGGLVVLDQANLTVRAAFAPGEDALAPYIYGQSLYVATRQGNLYKVNGVTMNLDLSFGNLGRVKVGESITAGPFLDAGGDVFVGTASGKVLKLDGDTGAILDHFNETTDAITGLVVTRSVNPRLMSGILAYTTSRSVLVQVTLSHLQAMTAYLRGTPTGGPVYEPVQQRFLVTTTSGYLYSIPAL